MSDYICIGTEEFVDVPDTDVDFKSPIDEFLMTTIRDDLRSNKCKVEQALASGNGNIEFKVNGNFNILSLGSTPENGLDLDGGFVSTPITLSRCALFVWKQGDGGNMVFDLKRSVYLNIPVSRIENIYTANTQSIARGSGALTTQTIVNAEPSQATQSINFAYTTESIDNIIQVQGAFQFQINFDPLTVDLDENVWAVGKYVVIDGASNAGNNGTFEIKDLKVCNGMNIIIENIAGVNEIPAAANAKPNYAKYFFTTAVPSNFVAGESATFLGHNDPTNNGTFEIFEINSGGNNIVVAKGASTLVEQFTNIGTIESLRWKYSFLNDVVDAFAIDEAAVFAGHVNAVNDGLFDIKNKNVEASFNIIIYNINGVAQPGVSGTVDTNRFVYALDSDPAGFFIVGDQFVGAGHDNVLNDGTFTIVDVKYLGNNNVVAYNAAGVQQLTPNGTVDHLQKAIIFRDDQSTNFDSGKSFVTVIDTADANNEGEYLVVDQNRAAVSNFNIIVEMPTFVQQLGDAGCIAKEVRSIFNNGQQTVNINQDKQIIIYEDNINTSVLGENTILSLDVTVAPSNMETLSVALQ